MKNKTARALAIIALVFMLIFSGSLIATLVDASLLNGGIGYLALSSGIFALMVFFALRADGKIASGRRAEVPQEDTDDRSEEAKNENTDGQAGGNKPDKAGGQSNEKADGAENAEADGTPSSADAAPAADNATEKKGDKNG